MIRLAPFSLFLGILIAPLISSEALSQNDIVHHVSLNGIWKAGHDHSYDTTLQVPGLAYSPDKMNEDTL